MYIYPDFLKYLRLLLLSKSMDLLTSVYKQKESISYEKRK